MSIATTLAAQNVDFEEKCRVHVGRLFVRLGLLATDKGKAGREKKDFALQEVQQRILEGVSSRVGQM